MLKSLIEHDFDPCTRLTIGVDFFKKEYLLFNRQVTAQFWDLGGVNRFDFLRPTYYLGANSIILVGDLTRPITFENIIYYLKLAKKTKIDPNQIILVGNKTDLFDRRSVSPSYLGGFVEEHEIAELIETSARFRDNLEIIFELATVIGLYNKGKISNSDFESYKEGFNHRILNPVRDECQTQHLIRKCWNCQKTLYF
ncbi:MAG: Rab family GTPase, partial [Promethearchaeota archaeon]